MPVHKPCKPRATSPLRQDIERLFGGCRATANALSSLLSATPLSAALTLSAELTSGPDLKQPDRACHAYIQISHFAQQEQRRRNPHCFPLQPVGLSNCSRLTTFGRLSGAASSHSLVIRSCFQFAAMARLPFNSARLRAGLMARFARLYNASQCTTGVHECTIVQYKASLGHSL
ncbi:hypothetical protein CC79DRAFT_829034 [Sarocladium strictum]